MDEFDYEESPCNGNCQLDHDDVCVGCLRTREEMINWWTMPLENKKKIWERIGIDNQ